MKHTILTMAILLLMTACHSTKQSPSQDYAPASEVSNQTGKTADVTPSAPVGITQGLAAQYDNSWTDLSVPVTLNVVTPASRSISGRVTMVRDRNIRISATVLGMEIGAVYIDKDSVFMYERIKKTYMAESLISITKTTGMTVGDIQALLMGRLFSLGSGPVDAATAQNFTTETSPTGKQVLLPAGGSHIDFGFLADEVDGTPILMGAVAQKGDNNLIISYLKPYISAVGPVAGEVSVLGNQIAETILSGSIIWKWDSAKWNTGNAPTTFNIPRGFSRVNASTLLKALKIK